LPADASVPDQNLRTSTNAPKLSRFKSETLAREATSSSTSTSNARNPHDSFLLSARSRAGGTGIRVANSAEDREAEADQAGHELAHLLMNAQNAGPSGSPSSSLQNGNEHVVPQEATMPRPAMVIPSLPPIRFPARDFNREDEFKGAVVLDESDEEESREDERLQQIMKERIEVRDRRENRKRMGIEEKNKVEAANGNVPPEVKTKIGTLFGSIVEKDSGKSAQSKSASIETQPQKNKVSRFMSARRAGED